MPQKLQEIMGKLHLWKHFSCRFCGCGRGVIHEFGNNELRNAIFAVCVNPGGKQIF